MGAIHTFVTEVFTDFVDTFETSDDQSFQIQFGSNTQIEVDIQRVMVRNERTCACPSGDGLQDRSFHFRISSFVQGGTHGLDNCRTFHENILYTIIDHQVDIALAITQFRIVESIVCYTVFVFDDR